MESLTEKHPQLKSLDINTIELFGAEDKWEMSILPAYPNIFKTASLWGNDGTILLEIKFSNIPTRTCGDKCAVNLKEASLLNEKFSIESPMSKCSNLFGWWNYQKNVYICQ